MTSLEKDILTIKEKKYDWMTEIVLKCYDWKVGHLWYPVKVPEVINSWKKSLSHPLILLYFSTIENKIIAMMLSRERRIYPEEMKYYISCLFTDLLIFSEKNH